MNFNNDRLSGASIWGHHAHAPAHPLRPPDDADRGRLLLARAEARPRVAPIFERAFGREPRQQTVGARFRSTSSSPSRSFGDSFSDELFKPIRGGIAERDGNSLEAWHAAHADIVVSREIESRRRREMLILAPKDDDDEPVAAPTAKDEDLTIAGFIAQRGGMPSRELQRCLRTTLR